MQEHVDFKSPKDLFEAVGETLNTKILDCYFVNTCFGSLWWNFALNGLNKQSTIQNIETSPQIKTALEALSKESLANLGSN